MPAKLERTLKATARKRGYSEKRAGAYVYGTLRKTGWTPSHQRKGGAAAARANATRRHK